MFVSKNFTKQCTAVLALVLSGLSVPVAAQRACGEQLLLNKLAAAPAAQALYNNKRAALLAEADNNTGAKTTAAYPIPVVFHVVVTQTQFNRLGGTAGIQQRCDSQIRVLNRDFSKSNPDLNLVPTAFAPFVANVGIGFGLANRKPNGDPTPGFEVRVLAPGTDSTYDPSDPSNTFADFISEVKYTSIRGLDAWDVSKYLNIWVCRITDGGSEGILGITTPPSFADGNFLPVDERGIVLTYGCFGKRKGQFDYYFLGTKFDKGRTLTHEMGHYFELRHIWGDDNGLCPSQPGGQDDGIADTPPQADENANCPSFPQISCNNGPNGDMFMNYLDYVDDGCMQMFSQGQAAVMRTNIQPGGESWSLTQQPGAVLGVGGTVAAAGQLQVYPNPAHNTLSISADLPAGTAVTYTLHNTVGQVVYRSAPIGNANTAIEIPVGHLQRGVYYLHCGSKAGTTVQKVVLQ